MVTLYNAFVMKPVCYQVTLQEIEALKTQANEFSRYLLKIDEFVSLDTMDRTYNGTMLERFLNYCKTFDIEKVRAKDAELFHTEYRKF